MLLQKARKQAAKEIKEAKSDPIASKTSKEDIILRILIARGKRNYVCQRLNQRANWLIVWPRKEWLEQQQKEDSIELVCIFVFLL